MPAISAVTFDFWDTLVAVDEASPTMRDRQIDGFAEGLLRHAHTFEREHLVEVFAENWVRFEAQWEANTGQYTPTDATDFIVERLSVPVTPEMRADLVDAFRVVGERVELLPAPGVEACLAMLKERGVKLAIVCDVGLTSSSTLRQRLEGFGLLRWFDAWSFSDETGWFKPAAEAFLPALDGLGMDATSAAHVGDNPRTDVAGALALGMTAVRYTGFSDTPGSESPEADHVAHDHREIPALLGIV